MEERVREKNGAVHALRRKIELETRWMVVACLSDIPRKPYLLEWLLQPSETTLRLVVCATIEGHEKVSGPDTVKDLADACGLCYR